jgi:hypothetical protein
VALFHYKERLQLTNGGKPLLLVTPADAWMAMRIFGQDMVLSALNLRDRDLVILNFLRNDMKEALSKSEIQMKLRDSGMNVTERDVTTSLDGMFNKGYVKKDESTNPYLWSATPFAKQVSADVKLDWSEVVEDTKKTAELSLGEDDAEEYIERFCGGDGLMVRNPFSGETVDIREANELEEVVEQKMGVEKEVIEQEGIEADEDEEPTGQQPLSGEIGGD